MAKRTIATTKIEIDTAYFDDLKEHIEELKNELNITDDSEHADALAECIVFLEEKVMVGHKWIENDITSEDWSNTYTDAEAIVQQRKWSGEEQ